MTMVLGTWYSYLLGRKPIGCRWVFAIKVKFYGLVACLKARLVAKGYV